MARPRENLVGRKFGRWTVKAVVGRKPGKVDFFWLCVCRCERGTEKEVGSTALRSGGSRSCGCLKSEVQSAMALVRNQKNKTHGMTKSREYNSWKQMWDRCTNPNDVSHWKDYGGRGIKVCERWEKFEDFFADMGPRPADHTLDRKDTNGDYTPENCRWATRLQQERNKRCSKLVTFNGVTKCVSEWAELYGITTSRLWHRLFGQKTPWSIEEALTIAPLPRGKKRPMAAE